MIVIREVQTTNKIEIDVHNGIYYGKVDEETTGLRYYKIIVHGNLIDEVLVMNNKYMKQIKVLKDEIEPSWYAGRILTEDKGVYVIAKEEFEQNYNEAIAFLIEEK